MPNEADFAKMGVLSIIVAQLALTTIVLAVKPAPIANVIATNLRGRSPEEKDQGEAKNQSEAPVEQIPKGHFYHADSCGDCFYKSEYCGCYPAMEYLACVTKHCPSENQTVLATRCSHIQSQCSQEVDVQCAGADTTCKPKWNQFPTGGLGFFLDRDGAEDSAYCGPFGKCIGTFDMKVKIHRPTPYVKMAAVYSAPAPSPTAPVFPVAPSPAPIFGRLPPKHNSSANVA